MKSFQAIVKPRRRIRENLYEFFWLNEWVRIDSADLKITLQSESVEKVYDAIAEMARDSVAIVHVVEIGTKFKLIKNMSEQMGPISMN